MGRLLFALSLAACWSGSSPTPVVPIPPPPDPKPIMVANDGDAPSCGVFDTANPACESSCDRNAPETWPGCQKQTAALIAQGYTCTTGHPFSCVAPPPPPVCPPAASCQPIHARVLSLEVAASLLKLTVGAGANQGVTTGWTAKLVDGNGTPVPNGTITITRVDQYTTSGTVALTPDQIRANLRVLLEP